MPGVSGVTVVTTLVCSFYFACEAAGASSARHSLRPLILGRAGRFQQNSREMRGEIAKSYLPSLRGAKRRSNPDFLLRFAKAGLLRFARNDVLKTPYVVAV
jgi:hypothetical protein